jgi:hypothetical protein
MWSLALWSVALVAGISWPGRAIGPLDGAPFDTWIEALALAVLLPALWWFHPAFLKTTPARAIVVLLLLWKAGGAMLLPQAGWCGDFVMANPPESGGWRLTRSWDARTVWERTPPSCSAIVARGYARPTQFPAWMINVPYGYDRWLKRYSADFLNLPQENPRPPVAEYRLNLHGAIAARSAGSLSFTIGHDVILTGAIDGEPVSAAAGSALALPLSPGSHTIDLQLALTGRDWKFVPLWNGDDVFSAAVTTMTPVSATAQMALRAGRWIAPALIVTLLGLWMMSAAAAWQPGLIVMAAVALVSAVMAWAGSAGDTSTLARLAVASLATEIVVPVPSRLRNARGAWLLVGVPWLAMIAAKALPTVGRFTLYLAGDDAQTYQRFAYRIYMERFWLEGGQVTFWNQPLYRWICGALHLFFGDSSAGEMIWDGFGLLAGAMFAFVVVNRAAGFRFGIGASVAVLLTFALGPNWYLIGRGLSEISALMWICLAGSCLMASGDPSFGRGLLAGAFATLGYYTRMNHLPLVIALGVLAISVDVTAGSSLDLRRLWRGLSKRAAAGYYAALTLGLCAFAARTWYFTGAFSLFAGTSLGFNSIGLGTSASSWWSIDVWQRTISSVLMLVTVQDPARFDWRSVLVVSGVGVSLLGLLHVPVARRLPLGIAVACVAALAGGLVVRGSAYPGRFSVHLIPIAVTASMLMAAQVRRALP